MYDTDDPRNIWISPDIGNTDALGTFDDPYPSIPAALKKASPGQTLVLMPGIYDGDLTIELSGDEKSPIYITSYKPGEAIIDGGCWYFYDTSDLVVSGMTFKNTPHGAISVVGQCLRNRFHSIKFVDCGGRGKRSSCAFYFGGAGGRFNIVEGCEFTRRVDGDNPASKVSIDTLLDSSIVGLMVSDGADGDHLTNHVIRNNRFGGYCRALIVGSGGGADFDSGHVVERNRVEDCLADGITVTCGDVLIRGNAVSKCAGSGIFLDGGRYSVAEGNIISYCNSGISVKGPGHTVCGNTIAVCKTAVAPIDNCDGLIDDENIVTQEIPAVSIDDDCAGDDFDEGYARVSAPDDYDDDFDNDGDDGGGDPQNGIEEIDIINYMFRLEDRQ